MNKKTLYLIIFGLLFLTVIFYIIKNNNFISSKISLPLAPEILTNEDSNNSKINKLRQQIHDLLIKKYPDSKDYYENFSLRGIGDNFAVVTINRPTGAGAIDELVNLKTGESVTLSETAFSVSVPTGFVYIDYDKIKYYALGQDNILVLPESILKDGESYDMYGGNAIAPLYEETHTDSSITVSVFDSSVLETSEGTTDYKFKKIRMETFYFLK